MLAIIAADVHAGVGRGIILRPLRVWWISIHRFVTEMVHGNGALFDTVRLSIGYVESACPGSFEFVYISTLSRGDLSCAPFLSWIRSTDSTFWTDIDQTQCGVLTDKCQVPKWFPAYYIHGSLDVPH